MSGATVVIGDTTRTTGDAGGCNFTDVTEGEHIVNVTKEGYDDLLTTITVDEDHLSFTISLTVAETVADGG